MDPLHGEDPLRSNQAATQQIIETLNLILDPSAFSSTSSSMALEKLLYMIQTNLTFDDTGIFFNINCQNPALRSMQLTFHVWLNNQLVYIACNAQTTSLRQKVLDLQLEMLAASYVKQRWLFGTIVQNYLNLLRELVADVDFDKLPHAVQAMQHNYVRSSDTDPVLAQIDIKSVSVQNTMVENCVKLITNLLPLVVNSDDHLFEQCATNVRLVFYNSNLHRKTQALHVFAKIYRRRTPSPADGGQSSHLLDTLAHQMLQAVHKIRPQLVVWLEAKLVRIKDVERFLGALAFLIGIKEFVKYCQSDGNRAMAVQFSAYLLQANQTDEERLLFGGTFAAAVTEFWKQIAGMHHMEGACLADSIEVVLDQRNRPNLEPEMVSLMQVLVRDWLVCGSGEEHVLQLVNELLGFAEDGTSEKEEEYIGI